MYAVVASGFSNVYTSWKDVDRVSKLYPYPKWKKCHSEEEAYEWIRRNAYGKGLHQIYNYGNTFSDLYIDAAYKIGDDRVFYEFNCRRIGHVRLHSTSASVEYKGHMIYACLPNILLSEESIASHMSAIYNMLDILGPNVDVNIAVPYYSIFYCLTSYSRGKSNPVSIVRTHIKERLGEVAVSLKFAEMEEDEP